MLADKSIPASALARDIKDEMVAYMIECGSCTRDDMLRRFSSKQIDRYGAAAAREASRRSERRAA